MLLKSLQTYIVKNDRPDSRIKIQDNERKLTVLPRNGDVPERKVRDSE